ncbi:MAG: hypothetical protein ACFFFB_02660 [Candidatus Heimdallarchaeota archaeon]
MSEIEKKQCQKCKILTNEYFTMYGESESGTWAEIRCKDCLIDFLHENDGIFLDSLYSISYSKDRKKR